MTPEQRDRQRVGITNDGVLLSGGRATRRGRVVGWGGGQPLVVVNDDSLCPTVRLSYHFFNCSHVMSFISISTPVHIQTKSYKNTLEPAVYARQTCSKRTPIGCHGSSCSTTPHPPANQQQPELRIPCHLVRHLCVGEFLRVLRQG